MKIIDRFLQYLDYKDIKPTRFEKEIGLSNGYLGTQKKRNADLGETIITKLLDNCLDLNPLWLLTGEGEMLRDVPMESPAEQAMRSDEVGMLLDRLQAQAEEIGRLKERLECLQKSVGDVRSDARVG